VAHIARLFRGDIKVVYTIQKEASRANGLEILVDRCLMTATSSIVASSGAALKSYTSRGAISKNGSVVYNCIDLRALEPGKNLLRDHYGVRTDFIIGTVGRLIPEKGYAFLLQALPQIANHVTSVCCVFLGDGPERTRLQEHARQLGVYDLTLWLGSRSDIQNFMPFFDVFVLPSITEAFGIAAAEASGFGVPVVCTDVGGLPEVVTHRISGFHVPPRDAPALASKVISLINDASMRTTMGAAGRRRAQDFAADYLAEKWLKIYEKALAR
jgi:glycosyltransferase involved in cell wall biosynthesis